MDRQLLRTFRHFAISPREDMARRSLAFLMQRQGAEGDKNNGAKTCAL